jgi:hypothetical protein
MNRRVCATILFAGMAAGLLFIGCDDNPVAVESDMTIITPAPGDKLLVNDTITVAWSKEQENVSLRYRDLSGGFSGTDTAWKSLQVLSQGPTQAQVVLPDEIADSLLVSLVDTNQNELFQTQYRLNHFILTRYPEPDRTYTVGDTIELEWEVSSIIAETLIMLEQDNGRISGFITGEAGVAVPQTRYSWVIGSDREADLAYPAVGCKVFLIDYNNFEWTDAMPGRFDITQ